MISITITSKTFNEGEEDEETVWVAELSENGTKLRDTFTYSSTWTEAEIDADVRIIMGERGYEV